MTPAESMKVIQKLYENGYITYPRTNTEYLATAEQKKINDMIQQLRKLGYKVEPKNGAKNIYDDSKIESHSALTPTYRMPETDRLTDKEKLVYEAILRRFLAVFSEVPCKVERTKITINVGVPEGPGMGENPGNAEEPEAGENPADAECPGVGEQLRRYTEMR